MKLFGWILWALLIAPASNGYPQDQDRESSKEVQPSAASTLVPVPEVTGAPAPGQQEPPELDEAELLRRYRAYKAESARERAPKEKPAKGPAAAKKPAKQPAKPAPKAVKEKPNPAQPAQEEARSEEAFLGKVVAIGDVQGQAGSKGREVHSKPPEAAKPVPEGRPWRRTTKVAPAAPGREAAGAWLALLLLLAVPAAVWGVWYFGKRKVIHWQADLASALREKAAQKPEAPLLPQQPKTPQTQAAQLASQPEVKKLAGRYELLRPVGRGPLGEVHEANDHSCGRIVALRKLPEDFLKLDPRAFPCVRHFAVAELYDAFKEGQDIYLAFELLKGKTVAQMLGEGRTLTLANSLDILRPVCEALEHAHSHNLMHRDIKPSNIMVLGPGQAKLMDFGVAGQLSRSGPSQAPSGTPAYSAPESEKGVVARESEVYAVGACLYQMLSGAPPFQPPASRVQKIRMDFAPASFRTPGLPPKIDSLISRALQPSPEQRIKTARQFLKELEEAVSP